MKQINSIKMMVGKTNIRYKMMMMMMMVVMIVFFFQIVDKLKCFRSKFFFLAGTTLKGYNHNKPLTYHG